MKRTVIAVAIFCVSLIIVGLFCNNDVLQEIRDIVELKTPSKGEKIRIAIIDSGANSELLTGETNFNFTNSNTCVDSIDHGTPIFNIIKHHKIGIATNAEVFSLKVVNDNGMTSMRSLENALEWCLENNINVVNISLSFSMYNENIQALIECLIDEKVIVVSSINNESVSIDYPSSYDGVIAVGYTENKDIYNSNTSIFFEKTYTINSISNNNYNSSYSGNSVLAPIVTGLIACILSENSDLLSDSDCIESVVLLVKELLLQTNLLVLK